MKSVSDIKYDKMLDKIIIVLINLCFVVGQEFLGLPEGSKCTKDGVDGTCANIYRCLNARADVLDKEYPPICTYNGDVPIICCTDCKLVNDTRLIYVSETSGQWYFRTGQKARDKCLDYMEQTDPCRGHYQGHIAKRLHETKNCHISAPTAVGAAGGKDAERNQYPHMAILGFGDDIDSASWLCGGSVISERYILTAGHCTSSGSRGPVKYIGLGILKRSDPPEIWQRYGIRRIVRHPRYDPPSKYHDIALLESNKRIKFNLNVKPACLDFDLLYEDNEGPPRYSQRKFATGWGLLGHRKELADTLQTLEVEEFSEEECSETYEPHRHLTNGYDHQTQMCLGHHTGIKDTCEGDSGGPLQSESPITHCQFTVVGITSYGKPCGFAGGSGIYTRVKPYISWIERVVWPND